MIVIPVSYGELFDKITILQIKKEKIKTQNVTKELVLLLDISKDISVDKELLNQLKLVNQTLWDIEDQIRIKERDQHFDQEFIDLARSVYIENDKRAKIKKHINIQLNSDIVEEKQYVKYG